MSESTYLKEYRNQGSLTFRIWPNDATLYQPYETEQIVLPESASCLAVKSFLKMRSLPFELRSYANAEFMSPGGRLTKLPFLRAGAFIMSEFEPIVLFVEQKRGTMANWLDEDQHADMHSYVSLVENIFTMAEYWISYVNEDVYSRITAPRNGCAHPWPLNHLQNYKKRRNALNILRVYQWHDMSIDDVIQKVDKCCETLVPKLLEKSSDYFYGDAPCELDAVVFGHVYTILTTPLPNMALASTVERHKPLVEFCKLMERKYFNTSTLGTVLPV